jgi:superfamily II RNA helicase
MTDPSTDADSAGAQPPAPVGTHAPMEYRGFTLDRFQVEAIEHLQAGRSVVVAAPTGTGKTIIADWIVDEALRVGRRVVYTAPIKALSNQKFRDYSKLWGDDNVGLVTGDLVIRREAPCRVMTTEILRNMLLAGESMADLHAVIIDEAHFLDDRERGTVWEEVLIYLPQHVLIVALSATIANMDEFARWLTHVRDRQVVVVQETRRTVPLQFHLGNHEGGLMSLPAFEERLAKRGHRPAKESRGRGAKGRDRGAPSHGDDRPTTPGDMLRMLRIRELFPCLYFVFSRKDTERFARQLARRAEGLVSHEELLAIEDHIADAAESLGSALDDDLREMLSRGVAYHHAGMHVYLKALVEELYEHRLVKVLFCTSTFALGINMPARAVVFHQLEKFDGQGIAPLTTREFMQMAGRAGRRGLDEVGHVALRLDFDDYPRLRPLIERYKKAAYEPVRSTFSLSWNSIVNLLERHPIERIREIVEKSFLSWHMTELARHQDGQAEELELKAKKDPAHAASHLKHARKLRRKASEAGERCWQEFEAKVTLLHKIGYLDEGRDFNAGARILRHLQISEIFVTELVLGGLFESLDDGELFGVLCALTGELPRGTTPTTRPEKGDRHLARELEEIRGSGPVVACEAMSGVPVVLGVEMIGLGRAWASGRSLAEVLLMLQSATDVAGTLVSSFRRAKDLASQLRDVFRDIPSRVEQINRVIRAVSRDEVEVVD